MSLSSLRGHSLKLNKKRVRLDVAKFSFSNRVVIDDDVFRSRTSGSHRLVSIILHRIPGL